METIFIKNMVCDRCKMVVKGELEKLNLIVGKVELGRIEILSGQVEPVKQQLKHKLDELGFELLGNEKDILNELIKTELINFLHKNTLTKENLSAYLSKKLSKEYSYLSKLFSGLNGITIEKYFIKLKIEKAKQLIEEDTLNFSEIAYTLGYNNLSHLSAQFKKETGLSLSEFKSKNNFHRKAVDKIL